RPPRDHLPRDPRARVPDAPGGDEPLPLRLPVRPLPRGGVPVGDPLPPDPAPGRSRHHLHSRAVHDPPPGVGTGVPGSRARAPRFPPPRVAGRRPRPPPPLLLAPSH